MIRSEKFLISRAPYAVKLDSFRVSTNGFWYVDALWYRRKSGVLSAHIGAIHGLDKPDLTGVLTALACWDGRWGGDCHGRWDGRGYWGSSEMPELQAKDLAVLRPMLESFPKVASGWVPEGYDGVVE